MASFVRSTANRAVHLQFTPRPSNLGESREILRLISQFGDVEYFKNHKYDTLSSPNTALVIFKSEDAARECLRQSPIRFRMGKAPVEEAPQHDEPAPAPAAPQENIQETTWPGEGAPWGLTPGTAPFGLSQTRSMSTRFVPKPPPRPRKLPFERPPPQLIESRIFQIQTNPARARFRDAINIGHYHGSFTIDTKSIAQKNLAKSVPSIGLSDVDWRAEGKPWRLMDKERRAEHEGPNRRNSLRELYNEGPERTATFRDEALPG